MAAIKRGLLIVLLLVFLEQAAIAKTKFEIVNGFFFQSGSGGKQVADGSGDQGLIVDEPAIYVDTKIGRNTTLFGSSVIDLWSSASEAIFDAQTGASGRGVAATPQRVLLTRKAFDLGVSQKYRHWTFTPTAGYSGEFDYTSLHGGMRIDRGFAQDNFVLSLAYSGYYDRTHPFDTTVAAFTDWQNKITHTIDLSATQILSPSDLVLVGYEFTRQDGFLAGTQNTVSILGARVSETMPSSRDRHAMTLRYVHGFNDFFSAHLDYRFYFDNWGIAAHSVEPALYASFAEDAGLIKIYYRIHLQTAVDYYADSFTARKLYMTSDSDLESLTANEGGVMFRWQRYTKHGPFKSIGLIGAATYYHRSNDLQAGILQASFTGEL